MWPIAEEIITACKLIKEQAPEAELKAAFSRVDDLDQSFSWDETSAEYTLLGYAAKHKNIMALRILLESGANVNAVDNARKQTALLISASHGSLEAVQLLLQWKADPDIINDLGRSALHLPASHGHEDIVRLLVEHGADVFIRDRQEKTAVDHAESAFHLHAGLRLKLEGVFHALEHAEEIRAEFLAARIQHARQGVVLKRPLSICKPLKLKQNKGFS